MAVQFSCPECGKVLKSANPIAPGKKVKCPSCAAIFSPAPAKAAAPAKRPVPADDETVELPKTRPVPAAGLKKPSKPALDDDPDADDEAPPPKPKGIQAKKPPPRIDDEDDDDGPPAKSSAVKAGKPAPKRAPAFDDDEDDEDRPKTKKKSRPSDEDEDFDDDDRPKKKKKKKAKSNTMMYGLIGGGAGLVVLLALLMFVWPGFLTSKSDGKKGPGPDGGPPPGPGPVAAGPDAMPFVPPDAVAVVGVSVASARTSKGGEEVWNKISEMAMKADAGKGKTAMDMLASVDKVVVGLLPSKGKFAKEELVAVLSFGAAVDEAKIHEVFETKPVPGKKYHKGGPGLLALPAEKIVVIGVMDDASFERYLDSTGKEASLGAELKSQVDASKDAMAYVALLNSGAMQQNLQEMAKGLSSIDKSLDPMAAAVQRFKSAALEIRESGGGFKIKGRMTCATEDDAKLLEGGISGFVKGLLPTILDATLKADKGVPPGVVDTLKSIVATFSSGVEGAQAWATLDISADNANALQNLAMMFFGAAVHEDRVEVIGDRPVGRPGPPMAVPLPDGAVKRPAPR